MLFFSHPSLGLQIGGRLLIANHLDQSSLAGTGSSSQIMFITLISLAGVRLCCASYQPEQIVQNNAGPKSFCWAKPTCFDFGSANLDVHGHIVPTERRWGSIAGWGSESIWLMHYAVVDWGLTALLSIKDRQLSRISWDSNFYIVLFCFVLFLQTLSNLSLIESPFPSLWCCLLFLFSR